MLTKICKFLVDRIGENVHLSIGEQTFYIIFWLTMIFDLFGINAYFIQFTQFTISKIMVSEKSGVRMALASEGICLLSVISSQILNSGNSPKQICIWNMFAKCRRRIVSKLWFTVYEVQEYKIVDYESRHECVGSWSTNFRSDHIICLHCFKLMWF